MAKRYIVDTNVLVRFFTKQPIEQAEKARSLIAAADSGQIKLIILPIIVAETIFTLQSFYKMDIKDIGASLKAFLQSYGIEVVEKDILLDALNDYENGKLGFVDAYIAASAAANQISIASFDQDFDKIKTIHRHHPN